MARPMRTPVQWDRGSVSVAPIAQPFKGILEDFGIPESAYSAEGGFGGSGLLDWEPAEFISPDVVWGTQYVSGAPPPSHYINGDGDDDNGDKKDNGTKCNYGKYADGSCKPKPDDGGNGDDDPTCSSVGLCGNWGACHACEEEVDPCKNCGPHQDCVNGQCVTITPEEEVIIENPFVSPEPLNIFTVAPPRLTTGGGTSTNTGLDTGDYRLDYSPYGAEDRGQGPEFFHYDPWAFEDFRGGHRR